MTDPSEQSTLTLANSLSRRIWLRRALTVGAGLVGAEAIGLGATFLYPQPVTTFNLGQTSAFPAALPADCSLVNQRGVFSLAEPKCFLIHLAAETVWQETGADRLAHLDADLITVDVDGSYWLALAQALPHFPADFIRFQECNRTFVDRWRGSFFDLLGDRFSGPDQALDRFPVHIDHQHNISIPRTPTAVPSYLERYRGDADLHRLAPLPPFTNDYSYYCP